MKFKCLVFALLVSFSSETDAKPFANKKIVCYFANWPGGRTGEAKHTPDMIDTNVCTHIIYAFASLDKELLVMKPDNYQTDIKGEYYRNVTAYKKEGKKVLISLGGYRDSKGDKYHRLLKSQENRMKFIQAAIQFLKTHNFDGLDLDYEFPACPHEACKPEYASDKRDLGIFIRELSTEFKPRGLLLSAAVSPISWQIEKSYDIPVMSKYLDWISIMSYNYHGQWESKTGLNAPFYSTKDSAISLDHTIKLWLEGEADKTKLIAGMPLYGRSFTLASAEHGLNAPAIGPGRGGPYINHAGTLAYYKICQFVQQGWTVVNDTVNGPYAYHDDQWVGYDDVPTVARKAQYVLNEGLGGAMVWDLSQDDFRDKCHQGKYPLMHAIAGEFNRETNSIP